jgi:hypothetical protein
MDFDGIEVYDAELQIFVSLAILKKVMRLPVSLTPAVDNEDWPLLNLSMIQIKSLRRFNI